MQRFIQIANQINFNTTILFCCFSILVLFSCESHEQKSDDAFEQVKEEKMVSKDSLNIKKTETVKKIETLDEWTKFQIEIEKKILSNEYKIKEIKNNPSSNSKLIRKATGLEKDNNDLRRQMDEYKEEMKVKWENFKVLINHNVNLISIELKDIKINNKKP